MRRLLIAALFCLFVSITAEAESFVILPNGEVAFNTSFTTQGVFTCTLCTGSGTNSVVFGSGGNTLTLMFSGVNTTILVGGQSQSILAGQIQVIASGSGFVFPAEGNPNQPLLFFSLGVNQSSPAAGTGFVLFNSGSGGGTSLMLHTTFSDYTALPVGPNPPGATFSSIVYSFSGFTIPNTTSVLDINANVVAIPEPMSLLLLGSGMGMMLRLLAKRRSRP